MYMDVWACMCGMYNKGPVSSRRLELVASLLAKPNKGFLLKKKIIKTAEDRCGDVSVPYVMCWEENPLELMGTKVSQMEIRV